MDAPCLLREVSFWMLQIFVKAVTADGLAQLIEHRTTVQEVVGSNPGWTTTQGL